MDVELWMWAATVGFILVMLALDLLVFHRKAHKVEIREATVFSAVWIAIGLGFGLLILAFGGSNAGGEYYAGYLIEKALSVDNIFVFTLIFAFFAVPDEYQHRVLFWGVIGALVLRGAFIAIGAQLLERYDYVVYLFGALLIYTGIRMAIHRIEEVHPDRNPVMKVLRKRLALTKDYHGAHLLVPKGKLGREEKPEGGPPLLGRWVATPLLMVLVVIETTDLVFALDSIPAVFSITTDTFIVFTSNAFALLGLRALYFMLAGALDRFVYLKYGLAAILVFVGAKFIYSDLFGKVPIAVSLAFIAIVLAVSIAVSLWATRTGRAEPETS